MARFEVEVIRAGEVIGVGEYNETVGQAKELLEPYLTSVIYYKRLHKLIEELLDSNRQSKVQEGLNLLVAFYVAKSGGHPPAKINF